MSKLRCVVPLYDDMKVTLYDNVSSYDEKPCSTT